MPRFSIAFAAAGVVLTLASASSGFAAGSAWDAGAGTNWQAITSRAKQEGSVTIGSPQPLPEVVAQFEKDTGLTVNVVTGTGTRSPNLAWAGVPSDVRSCGLASVPPGVPRATVSVEIPSLAAARATDTERDASGT